MNKKEDSLPVGVCKLSEKLVIEECCVDFFLQDGKCVVCPPGRIGFACAEECPHNYYGLSCRYPCECESFQICDPVWGCCEPPCATSTFPQDSINFVNISGDYAVNKTNITPDGESSITPDDLMSMMEQYGLYILTGLGLVALVLVITACKKVYERSKRGIYGSSNQDIENGEGRNTGYAVPMSLDYDQLQGVGDENDDVQSVVSFSTSDMSSTIDENVDARKDDGYEEPDGEFDDKSKDRYETAEIKSDESNSYEKPDKEHYSDFNYVSRYETLLKRTNEEEIKDPEGVTSDDNVISSQQEISVNNSEDNGSVYEKKTMNVYEVALRLTQAP